jgi:hypothetical protein
MTIPAMQIWVEVTYGHMTGEDCCLCHDIKLPLALLQRGHHIVGTLVPSAGKGTCMKHPLMDEHI